MAQMASWAFPPSAQYPHTVLALQAAIVNGRRLVSPCQGESQVTRYGTLAHHLPSPSTRFSQDFNIFRRKFTDSAEYPPYIYLASAIWVNEWWDAP